MQRGPAGTPPSSSVNARRLGRARGQGYLQIPFPQSQSLAPVLPPAPHQESDRKALGLRILSEWSALGSQPPCTCNKNPCWAYQAHIPLQQCSCPGVTGPQVVTSCPLTSFVVVPQAMAAEACPIETHTSSRRPTDHLTRVLQEGWSLVQIWPLTDIEKEASRSAQCCQPLKCYSPSLCRPHPEVQGSWPGTTQLSSPP